MKALNLVLEILLDALMWLIAGLAERIGQFLGSRIVKRWKRYRKAQKERARTEPRGDN